MVSRDMNYLDPGAGKNGLIPALIEDEDRRHHGVKDNSMRGIVEEKHRWE